MQEPALSNIRIASEVSLPGDFLSLARDAATGDLFVGNTMGKIYRIDPDLGRADPYPRLIHGHISFVSSLVVSGDALISGGSDHKLIWWDTRSHDKLREVKVHPKWIRQIKLSDDGTVLATVCDDMVARLFDSRSGKLLRELRGGHEILSEYNLLSKLYTCAFTPDGKHLATADQTGKIVVWEISSGKQVIQIQAPHFFYWDTNGHTYGGIRSLDFSPDGTLLAAGGNLAGCTSTISGSKSMIQVYNWKSGEQTHDFRVGGNFFYERVKFHHEGAWLLGAAGAGGGHKLVFFDLEKKEIAHQQNSGMLTFDLVMSKTSDTIYVAGRRGVSKTGTNGTLVQWDLSRRMEKF